MKNYNLDCKNIIGRFVIWIKYVIKNDETKIRIKAYKIKNSVDRNQLTLKDDEDRK